MVFTAVMFNYELSDRLLQCLRLVHRYYKLHVFQAKGTKNQGVPPLWHFLTFGFDECFIALLLPWTLLVGLKTIPKAFHGHLWWHVNCPLKLSHGKSLSTMTFWVKCSPPPLSSYWASGLSWKNLCIDEANSFSVPKSVINSTGHTQCSDTVWT